MINQLRINLVQGRRRGFRALRELELEDELYLVGAYNASFVRYCAALAVSQSGKRRIIYDEDDGKPLSAHPWMEWFSFVWPFCVFKLKA